MFVVPCEGYFRVAFTIGDKAADLVFAADLPEEIKKQLMEARKYAEGRSLQVEVKSSDDCENVLKIIRCKLVK